MSESDPTGYADSPDTADGDGVAPQEESAAESTLTTDHDAQHEDSIMRPGNEPD
jgi:hypothetical protein